MREEIKRLLSDASRSANRDMDDVPACDVQEYTYEDRARVAREEREDRDAEDREAADAAVPAHAGGR